VTAALLLALAAAASRPFHVEPTRTSPRHPQLVLAPRAGERAALLVRFHAGSVDDAQKPGLTRVVQRVLVEASRRHPYAAFARDLFAADGSLEVETGLREATFVLEVDRRDFDRLAGILLDLLLAPDLDPARYRRARERALMDQRDSTGRSDWVALLAPKVIEDWRYGNAPYGELDTLERIQLGDVQAHLAGPMSPANATVVAAGAFDAKTLRARVARHTGAAPEPAGRPQLSTPFSLQIPARKEVYVLAFATPFGSPERTASARILASLLQDRIHRVFREKGLGYSELVAAEHRRWLDLFLLVLPAHDPSSLPLGVLLEDEVESVKAGRFTEAELERNRGWTLAELARIDREPGELVRELADGADPAWFGPEVVERVRTASRAGLERAFPEILAEPAAIRVLYTPNASSRSALPDSYRRRGGAR
jgi:predicted Zn-dependent peptidase